MCPYVAYVFKKKPIYMFSNLYGRNIFHLQNTGYFLFIKFIPCFQFLEKGFMVPLAICPEGDGALEQPIQNRRYIF